jgi:putative transcriptional regulator
LARETSPVEHRIDCQLDTLLAEQGLTLAELASRVGVTVVNLSVLKNNRAKAIRFSTLTAICDVLGCQPGDLLKARDRQPRGS